MRRDWRRVTHPMPMPPRAELDTIVNLIDTLKDVARLQQLVETLADNQRDLTTSLTEARELYAERLAALVEHGRRLDEVAQTVSKLVDRVAQAEQRLAQHGQVDDQFHADFTRTVTEFRTQVVDLHRQVDDKTDVDRVRPGVAHFSYGKVSATVSNYLIVLFLVAVTVWSLSPLGRHFVDKYLPISTSKQ